MATSVGAARHGQPECASRHRSGGAPVLETPPLPMTPPSLATVADEPCPVVCFPLYAGP